MQGLLLISRTLFSVRQYNNNPCIFSFGIHTHILPNTRLNADICKMPDRSKSIITTRSSNKKCHRLFVMLFSGTFVNQGTSRNMSFCFLVALAPHLVHVPRFHGEVVCPKSFCEMSRKRGGCRNTKMTRLRHFRQHTPTQKHCFDI